MSRKEIIDYLRKHRKSYSSDQLNDVLRQRGVNDKEIENAWKSVNSSSFGIIALILAVLSLSLFWISFWGIIIVLIAIIFCIIAIVKGARGMAISGLVLACIAGFILPFWILSSASIIAPQNFKTGETTVEDVFDQPLQGNCVGDDAFECLGNGIVVNDHVIRFSLRNLLSEPIRTSQSAGLPLVNGIDCVRESVSLGLDYREPGEILNIRVRCSDKPRGSGTFTFYYYINERRPAQSSTIKLSLN